MPKVIDTQRSTAISILLKRNKLAAQDIIKYVTSAGEIENSINLDILEQVAALISPNKREPNRLEQEVDTLGERLIYLERRTH